MSKNSLLFILAFFIILPLVIACSDNDIKDNVAATSSDSAGESESTAAETKIPSGLPDTDWEGRTVTFVTRGTGYGDWETRDISADTETGEPINDSVYKRNITVEVKYNLNITEQKLDNLGTAVATLILAGDDSFDAIICSGSDGSMLSTSSCLVDLHTVPNLQLDMPWWDQNANVDFSIGGRLFITCSDISISDKDGSWIVVFNKRLLKDYNIDDLYETVNNNKWTYETYHDMAKIVSADLNGDGKMNETDDLWGIGTEEYDSYAAFFYSGERIFKNVEGYPTLVVYNERSSAAYDKYMEIMQDNEVYHEFMKPASFIDGRVFLRGTTMLQIQTDLRNMEDDFGILPTPKYEESQQSYYHVVSIGTSASIICVPVTSPDLDFTGFAIEALSYESTDTLMDTYYNTCFNGKYLRDESSVDMLKLVVSTRVYDFSIIYTDWGDWFSYFYGLGGTTPADLASKYAAMETPTITAMTKTIDYYRSLG